jgi:hypothetical protein
LNSHMGSTFATTTKRSNTWQKSNTNTQSKFSLKYCLKSTLSVFYNWITNKKLV